MNWFSFSNHMKLKFCDKFLIFNRSSFLTTLVIQFNQNWCIINRFRLNELVHLWPWECFGPPKFVYRFSLTIFIVGPLPALLRFTLWQTCFWFIAIAFFAIQSRFWFWFSVIPAIYKCFFQISKNSFFSSARLSLFPPHDYQKYIPVKCYATFIKPRHSPPRRWA